MASLLRQIVAGPRARHPEAGLDLCYVTDKIIATSGPSGTYPQRAYRNPLDSLVKFLDAKHGTDWAIWEFRAEGTGYPDSEVYNRVYHYPFPDHHPPPFALIPNIMASMRNWMKENDNRVVVVHCKAGKGRSGTISCSYLISEEGWKVHDALKRFTERRMRPGFGAGVSIPSQLRWIGYVDRWTKHGKMYVERQIEILEVHCWGLRDGVKIEIEGFVDEGKTIKRFHTFTRSERDIVRGEIAASSGLANVVAEVIGKTGGDKAQSKKEPKSPENDNPKDDKPEEPIPRDSTASSVSSANVDGACCSSGEDETLLEGTGDVIFRPSSRVVLPTNDINLDIERRNKAAYGLTMVTSVAHVWFNAFFEGNGPEQNGEADDSGVFTIEWGKMDGIKGSSRRGTRAFSKVAVVWRALKDESGNPGIVITEPKEGEEVKQTSPADWTGKNHVSPSDGKDLGLRTSSPSVSDADVSRASSIKSQNAIVTAPRPRADTTEGMRSHGPNGEKTVEPPSTGSGAESSSSDGSPISTDEPSEGTTHTESMQPGGGSASQPADSRTGVVGGVQHVSTDDLPGGRPEKDLKTATEHALGHLKLAKKVHASSS
jgi:protein-tyrosine phosphatase